MATFCQDKSWPAIHLGTRPGGFLKLIDSRAREDGFVFPLGIVLRFGLTLVFDHRDLIAPIIVADFIHEGIDQEQSTSTRPLEVFRIGGVCATILRRTRDLHRGSQWSPNGARHACERALDVLCRETLVFAC